jgi:DNA (cytosine-5)-methyltransferase 1
MTLTVGSLFSGIGGIDLGLERAGMNVIWQSEIDPFACKVLKKHWPEVPNHGDIKEIKWHEIERPDIICGGYPCQPFSTAGKRRGNQDPRHLWPWVRHAISQLRPRYAIMENVRGHLSMGGTDVLSDLAGIGYDAEWRVISAASVGANHKRDRVIIVAYPNGSDSTHGRQREVISSEDRSGGNDGTGSGSNIGEIGMGSTRQSKREVAYPDGERLERRGRLQRPKSQFSRPYIQSSDRGRASGMADTDSWETGWRLGSISEDSGLVFGRDNIRRGTEGYAGWQWWESEPDVGRVAHGVSNRVDRLKGLGNAVVPQVAEIVGRLVMEAADQ